MPQTGSFTVCVTEPGACWSMMSASDLCRQLVIAMVGRSRVIDLSAPRTLIPVVEENLW